MEINGKLKEVFEPQEFKSGFKKREFVVTTQEQYPQDVKFELYNDKCDLIDGYEKGQQINVQFNIKGNEYNGRYFVNLNAWKITMEQQESAGDNAGNMPPPPLPDDAPADLGHESPDDLPF